jgi:hypothetical protein
LKVVPLVFVRPGELRRARCWIVTLVYAWQVLRHTTIKHCADDSGTCCAVTERRA